MVLQLSCSVPTPDDILQRPLNWWRVFISELVLQFSSQSLFRQMAFQFFTFIIYPISSQLHFIIVTNSFLCFNVSLLLILTLIYAYNDLYVILLLMISLRPVVYLKQQNAFWTILAVAHICCLYRLQWTKCLSKIYLPPLYFPFCLSILVCLSGILNSQ